MNVPRSSLRSFLASAKTNLQNAIVSQQRVTIVSGNESADLDSITSAILFAYLRSSDTTSPLTNSSVNKHTPPSQYPPFYIPLINIPRADIEIRPELLALLPHANIEPSHLITLDDINAEPPAGVDPAGREQLSPQLTRLLLVDHNKLDGPLATRGFDDRVIGCVDHHVDEGTVPASTGNEPRIIETCGSCMSLVIEYCRPAWDALSGSASVASYATAGQSDASVGVDDDAVRRTWDAQVAKLAIASVLVDTNGLKDESKTTDKDRRAVEYLEAKIFLAPGGVGAKWNRDAFLDEISSAKKDLGRLQPEQILRKDYKQWEVKGKLLGISSVVQPLAWQIEKAGGAEKFSEVMKHFASQRKLSLFSIMTTSTSSEGEYQRELALYSLDSETDSLVEQFQNQSGDELGLKKWGEVSGFNASKTGVGKFEVWWQSETKFSRKQVAPLLRKVIEQS